MSETICFVAGTVGTLITTSPLPGEGSVAWPAPHNVLARRSIEWMELAANGVLPGGDLGRPTFGHGPVAFFYGPFANRLRDLGAEVIGLSMDWRMLTTLDVARLVGVLTNAKIPAPIHIIAHSRGGLVASRAVKILADAGQLDRVGRVITLGTPFKGTMAAAVALAGHNRVVRWLSQWLAVHPINDQWRKAREQAILNRVLRSWPSFYEQLPDPSASWPVGVRPIDYYIRSNWGLAENLLSDLHLATAATRWASLPAFPAQVEVFCVAGRGWDTPTGCRSIADLVNPGSWLTDSSGDGLVVPDSARIAGRPTMWADLTHDQLAQDYRVADGCLEAIRSGLSGDVDLT